MDTTFDHRYICTTHKSFLALYFSASFSSCYQIFPQLEIIFIVLSNRPISPNGNYVTNKIILQLEKNPEVKMLHKWWVRSEKGAYTLIWAQSLSLVFFFILKCPGNPFLGFTNVRRKSADICVPVI